MVEEAKANEQIRRQVSFTREMLGKITDLIKAEGITIQEYIRFLVVKDLREQSTRNAKIAKTIRFAETDMKEIRNFQKEFRDSVEMGKFFLYLKRKSLLPAE